MTDYSPPCLARLQLGADADRRAIRSAYARELKLLDQALDASGFQALREAYEAALHWAATADSPASLQVSLAKEASDQGWDHFSASGRAVFERFHTSIAPLLQGQDADKQQLLENALRHALEDDSLVNLSARDAFEDACVTLLINGWRPGHETLLDAAILVFRWNEDGSHLEQMGVHGRTLIFAMHESFMAKRQRDFHVRKQHQILTRLRLGRDPEAHFLQSDMPHLRLMQSRFPHLLPIIADSAAIERWYRACPDIDPEEPDEDDMDNPYYHKSPSSGPGKRSPGETEDADDLGVLWRICQILIFLYIVQRYFF